MNPPDRPNLHGLDPGELLARGFHTVRPSGPVHGWTPPTVEELAHLLPQFRIESLLGRGGMGAVYKAWQEKLGRAVAIKVLPAELTADEQFVARFEREARTLAQLQHPGIVSIYDFGQTPDGHLYFVMEFVEGTDLRRVLQGPGLEPAQALEVIVQICEALQAAHRQGVVHRDIKPANILLSTEGRVKLADFGLARPDQETAEPLTVTQAVLGTPDYMAPEQRQGRSDARADIYALGVTLYEMLTGQLPRGAFVPPSRKVQVDVRIDEVVLKALQEEPERRYQQADEMKTDVDAIRSGISPAVRKKPVPWALVAGLVLGLLAVVGAALWATHRPVPAPAAPQPAPVADETPAALVDFLCGYDWQYKTTRPTTPKREGYSFIHGLVFNADGTVFSRGRNQLWKWQWTLTGPRTLRLDRPSRGLTMTLTFDDACRKFTGELSDGSTVEGFRVRRFSAEEENTLRTQLQERFAAREGTDDSEPTPP